MMKQHILFCAIHIASRLACVTETDHTSFSQMKKPCVRTSGEGCTYGNVRTCLQSTVYSIDTNRMHHSQAICFGDLSMLHGYSILSFLEQSRFDPLEIYCSTALNSVPTYLSGCGLINGYLTTYRAGISLIISLMAIQSLI